MECKEEVLTSNLIQLQITSYYVSDYKVPPIAEDSTAKDIQAANTKAKRKSETWLYLFGRTSINESICLHIQCWSSFVLEIPEQYFNKHLQHPRMNSSDLQNFIISKFPFLQTSLHFEELSSRRLNKNQRSETNSNELQNFKFLKIYCKSKSVQNQVQKLFYSYQTRRSISSFDQLCYDMIEDDIPLVTEMFARSNFLVPSGFIEININNYHLLTDRYSTCDVNYSIEIAYDKLPCRSLEWNDVYAYKIVAIDIESPAKIGFCQSNVDPIRCVASYVYDNYTSKFLMATHTYGHHTMKESLSEDGNSWVKHYCYDTELEMLEGWREFMLHVDPDWITGWNIDNFDFLYMFQRMELLSSSSMFFYFSRLHALRCSVEKVTFTSKQKGAIENVPLLVPGRINMDLLQHWMNEFRLRSYTLKSVSMEEFPMEPKKEMSFEQMRMAFDNADIEKINETIEYVARDAELVIKLILKHQVIVSYIELSKITFTFMSDLISHGKIYSTTGMLYVYCKKAGSMLNHSGAKLQPIKGGEVLMTRRGYYSTPIVTLDFQSLYPSIMIAHNMCYSTFLLERESDSDLECVTDVGTCYFRQSTPGILPTMLQHLLDSRKQAKTLLKHETRPHIQIILHQKQLALKLAANSVYGFTCAPTNWRYGLTLLGASVTAIGRTLIINTKNNILQLQKHLKVRHIAGDTDSVMIEYPLLKNNQEGIKKCFELAKQAADSISKGPIVLKVEKVFSESFFFGQKEYGGLELLDALDKGKVIIKGGFGVKRNYAPLLTDIFKHVYESLLLRVYTKQEEIVYYVHQQLEGMVTNDIDLHSLALSVKLGKYEQTEQSEKLIQQRIVRLIEGRNEQAPKPGERIFYIILIKPGAKGVGDQVEDLNYVLAHRSECKVDYNYYLDSLTGPLTTLIALRFGNAALIQDFFQNLRSKLSKTRLVISSTKSISTKGFKRVLGSTPMVVDVNKPKQRKLIL